jgi:hypothetical protein
MGVVGWATMILLWTALVAVVVWAITRLFPEHTPTPQEKAHTGPGDSPPRVESGRH